MNDWIFTTYQVADICNVHHTTVINWANEGKLKVYTTPGGHRRIERDDLMAFMKKYGMPIPKSLMRRIKKVLVVDDDIEAVNEYLEALKGHGFDIDCAYDGFGAGRKIYKDMPDLILLDFKMPGMNGFDVCENLKKDVETAHIPVIAVTVLNSEEDIKKIEKFGVADYFSKPIDIEKLLKAIKEILGVA